MDTLQIGEIKIYWLRGGRIAFDGGAMFGVVPKPLWSKKYPPNAKNQVMTYTDPMYFKYQGKHFLIDAGIGNHRLTDKQKRNYGVSEESFLEEDLSKLDVTADDIDFILMTHLHFDHVLGLTGKDAYGYDYSKFKNATILVSATEWEEMRRPNIRSKATYWRENYQAIESQIKTYTKEWKFDETIQCFHTGGHSKGHSAILIRSEDDTAFHMGDIFPTVAHENILWVTAYDDYPIDSIFQKKALFAEWKNEKTWFLFYHDARYRAIQYNLSGDIQNTVQIKKETQVKFPPKVGFLA